MTIPELIGGMLSGSALTLFVLWLCQRPSVPHSPRAHPHRNTRP